MTVGGVGGAGRYDPPLRSGGAPRADSIPVGAAAPEGPAAKAERLKHEVVSGTYKPNPRQIAAAILAAAAQGEKKA